MTRPTIDRLVALSIVAGLASVAVGPRASAEPPPSAGTAGATPDGTTASASAPAANTDAGQAAQTARKADRQSDAALDRRIADLRARLRITTSEEPAWQAFTAVMRQNAQEMDGKLAARKSGFGTMSAVDDLRSYADIQAAQAAGIERLVGPFQTLYAELTPAQRTMADQLFRSHTDRALQRAGRARG